MALQGRLSEHFCSAPHLYEYGIDEFCGMESEYFAEFVLCHGVRVHRGVRVEFYELGVAESGKSWNLDFEFAGSSFTSLSATSMASASSLSWSPSTSWSSSRALQVRVREVVEPGFRVCWVELYVIECYEYGIGEFGVMEFGDDLA